MIHVFILHSLSICLDVNSGTIHLLDEVTFDLLSLANTKEMLPLAMEQLKDKYDKDILLQAMDEITSLIEQESLYSKDFTKEELQKNTTIQSDMKAMCLHMAHDCNLRCSYCFADKGVYGGDKGLMSIEVAKAAIDYLLENSGKKVNVEVDFFGGEPLLNFKVIKQCVVYAKEQEKKYSKNVNFTITTNGTIFSKEINEFLQEHMDNIVLSLDGRKSVHDHLRVYPSGKGSYDKVVENIKEIANNRQGKSYFIRGTYTRDNLDFYEDVKHIYEQLGLKEISIEPVSGGDFTLTDEEIAIAMTEYERFAKEYAKQDDYRFYHFTLNIYNSPCIYKRIAACGAGVDYGAVSPDGKIYACHQFVGEDEFVMGNIYDGVTNTELRETFANNNVFTKQECPDCWAKYFCSGGCHANAYYTNGDIAIPDKKACTLQKKRIECALMIECQRTIDRSNNDE